MKGFIIMLMSLLMFCAMTIASNSVQGTEVSKTQFINHVVEADWPVYEFSNDYFINTTICPVIFNDVKEEPILIEMSVLPDDVYYVPEVTYIWPSFQSISISNEFEVNLYQEKN